MNTVRVATWAPGSNYLFRTEPFLLIGEEWRGAKLREMGVLADVAPTLMRALDLEQPTVMDGVALQSS